LAVHEKGWAMSDAADATRKELREAGYTHDDAEEAERVAGRLDLDDQDEDGRQGLDQESDGVES
jgi:hypothetical protein